MIIERILTNNALVIKNDSGSEIIVCGKGIGFKKIGDSIDETLINQKFFSMDNIFNNQVEELIKNIPIEIIESTDKIIKLGEKELSKSFGNSLVIFLSDHLDIALKRFADGVNISNGLMWDIKAFYPTEFNVGLKGLDFIEKKLAIRLPDAEAAYIAIHFVNASMEGSDMDEVYQVTKIVQQVIQLIQEYYSIDLNVDSIYYIRFFTHIRFFAQRLVRNKTHHGEEDYDFFNVAKLKYSKAYECVEKLNGFFEQKYQYTLSSEEKLYLTIHIHRVAQRGIKQEL